MGGSSRNSPAKYEKCQLFPQEILPYVSVNPTGNFGRPVIYFDSLSKLPPRWDPETDPFGSFIRAGQRVSGRERKTTKARE